MNEALKKELIERFRAEAERPDSLEFKKAYKEYELQRKKVEASHKGANLSFERELEALDDAAWAMAREYAADSFIFGYEHCLTMLGLKNEKALSQQDA